MDIDFLQRTLNMLLHGFGLTLYIGIAGIVLASFFGVLFALMRISSSRGLRAIGHVYSAAFRGTPLLVQLFVIYYGIATLPLVREHAWLWWFFSNGANCAILTIALNSGAYMSEVIRGGLQSVPVGAIEAGKAYGMSPILRFKHIVFPLAIRQALPAYSNELVLAIKGTSLASTIAVMEITGFAKQIMSQSFIVVYTFAVAGLLYLAINFSLLLVARLIEQKLNIKQTM